MLTAHQAAWLRVAVLADGDEKWAARCICLNPEAFPELREEIWRKHSGWQNDILQREEDEYTESEMLEEMALLGLAE